MKGNISFKKIVTPEKKSFYIPTDIKLVFPKTDLPLNVVRSLVYIPWEHKYLSLIPKDFVPFFKVVLPYLKVRTTDVHTAVCLSYMDNFIKELEEEKKVKINRGIVGFGLILHDCGWSALSESEIADSLSSYKGLKIKGAALKPKRRHAEEGLRIAREVLNTYKGKPKLTEEEKETVCNAVFWHDTLSKVEDINLPIEIKTVVDLDRLWSFTYLNFWQNTIRKDVSPQDSLKNLNRDLDDYLIFEISRNIGRSLLKEREKEVAILLARDFNKKPF